MVKLVLAKRHYGVHTPVKTIEVDLDYDAVVTVEPLLREDGSRYGSRTHVDEDAVLAVIPEGFLPQRTEWILLCAGDEHGSSGVYDTKHFKSWAKYFDAYSLTVQRPDEED